MGDASKVFVKEVDTKLKRIGKTRTQLAKEIKIEYATLNRIINSQRKLDFNLAVIIANHLDINLNKYLRHMEWGSSEDVRRMLDEIDVLMKKVRDSI